MLRVIRPVVATARMVSAPKAPPLEGFECVDFFRHTKEKRYRRYVAILQLPEAIFG